MLSFLFFSVKRAWQGFWRNALMSLAATATMILMLLLLAGFWIIQAGLLASLEFIEQKVEVVADLEHERDRVARSTRSRPRSSAMPEVASVEYVTPRQGARALPRAMEAQGRTDLTRYLDSNPLLREPRGQARRPVRARGRRRRPRPERAPDRPQRQEHRGPGRPAADRHQHPADGGHGPARRDRADRAVHHHQHDPPGGRRPGRGDRDHAPGRRVGRVHPLAVRVRGGVRRPSSAPRSTLAVLAGAAEPLDGFMVEFFQVLPLQIGSLDARPRDPGDGRRPRPRHPRLLGLGSDLPDPLGTRGVAPLRPYLRRRGPRSAAGGTFWLPVAPVTRRPSSLDSEATRHRHALTASPISRIGRRCPSRRSIRALKPSPAASPILSVAVTVVALLAGSALFLSRLLGRPPDARSSRARRPPTGRRSSRSGTSTTRSRPLRRRRGRSRDAHPGRDPRDDRAPGDPYSSYLSSEEYRASLQGISGQFEGIGAEIATRAADGNRAARRSGRSAGSSSSRRSAARRPRRPA